MLELRDVDKADEGQLHTWHSTWAAAVRHRPPELVTSWEIARVDIGLATFEAAAVGPDGAVVALTGVRVSTHDRGRPTSP